MDTPTDARPSAEPLLRAPADDGSGDGDEELAAVAATDTDRAAGPPPSAHEQRSRLMSDLAAAQHPLILDVLRPYARGLDIAIAMVTRAKPLISSPCRFRFSCVLPLFTQVSVSCMERRHTRWSQLRVVLSAMLFFLFLLSCAALSLLSSGFALRHPGQDWFSFVSNAIQLVHLLGCGAARDLQEPLAIYFSLLYALKLAERLSLLFRAKFRPYWWRCDGKACVGGDWARQNGPTSAVAVIEGTTCITCGAHDNVRGMAGGSCPSTCGCRTAMRGCASPSGRTRSATSALSMCLWGGSTWASAR